MLIDRSNTPHCEEPFATKQSRTATPFAPPGSPRRQAAARDDGSTHFAIRAKSFASFSKRSACLLTSRAQLTRWHALGTLRLKPERVSDIGDQHIRHRLRRFARLEHHDAEIRQLWQ